MNLEGPYNPSLISSYGTLLLSCYVPIEGATFYDVVGRNPQNGESVTTLDGPSQTSTISTYENALGTRCTMLNVGQSAFFNLEPAPEPEMFSLLGAGVVALAAYHRVGNGNSYSHSIVPGGLLVMSRTQRSRLSPR